MKEQRTLEPSLGEQRLLKDSPSDFTSYGLTISLKPEHLQLPLHSPDPYCLPNCVCETQRERETTNQEGRLKSWGGGARNSK